MRVGRCERLCSGYYGQWESTIGIPSTSHLVIRSCWSLLAKSQLNQMLSVISPSVDTIKKRHPTFPWDIVEEGRHICIYHHRLVQRVCFILFFIALVSTHTLWTFDDPPTPLQWCLAGCQGSHSFSTLYLASVQILTLSKVPESLGFW